MDRERTALTYLGATVAAGLVYAVLYAGVALPGGATRLLGIGMATVFSLSPVMVALNTARELLLLPSIRTAAAVLVLGVHLYFAGKAPAPADDWRRIGFRAIQGVLGPVLVVPYVFFTGAAAPEGRPRTGTGRRTSRNR